MPQPVYIICSESGAEDKATGLTSLFNIVERVLFTPGPGPDIDGLPMRVMAVWLRDEGDDPSQRFESEFTLLPPGATEELLLVATGNAFFAEPMIRVVAYLPNGLPFPPTQPGLLYVTHRLRPVGTEEWVSQKYPIFLDIAPAT